MTIKNTIATLALIGSLIVALPSMANSCDGSDTVFCEHWNVHNQPQQDTGYYARLTVNGKTWPTGIMCVRDDDSWGGENEDMKQVIKMGLIQLGNNTAVLTQCSDKSCSQTGPSFEYDFTLNKLAKKQYTANPARKEVTLQTFGNPCTTGQTHPTLKLT